MSHGGNRNGAGRKARSEPREAVTIRIEAKDADKFRKVCKANKRSQSEQLTAWIRRAKI